MLFYIYLNKKRPPFLAVLHFKLLLTKTNYLWNDVL